MELTTCFYLLMQMTCCARGFSCYYSVSICLFLQSDVRCQEKQVEPTTCFYLLMQITCCATGFSFEYSVSICLFIQSDVNKTKLGQGYVFTSRICGSCRNMYGWHVGGTHPTAMLSYLLIKIGCCDLFLEIYFLKSIFIKRTSFGTIS